MVAPKSHAILHITQRIGHGQGGEVRAAMGVRVIGGLITSTILTLVVVPVIFALMDGLIVRVRRLWARVTGGGAAPTTRSARDAQRSCR